MPACGAFPALSVELRNGFHMSITARRIPLHFRGSQPLEEEIHALLGAVCASEPDRPAADQIADDDAVVVPPADGEFVDADHLRAGCPGPSELLAHVLHFQRLDRLPIEAKFASHISDVEARQRRPT